MEVANPLRILSAYLTTAATNKPPYACNKEHLLQNDLKLQLIYVLNIQQA